MSIPLKAGHSKALEAHLSAYIMHLAGNVNVKRTILDSFQK